MRSLALTLQAAALLQTEVEVTPDAQFRGALLEQDARASAQQDAGEEYSNGSREEYETGGGVDDVNWNAVPTEKLVDLDALFPIGGKHGNTGKGDERSADIENGEWKFDPEAVPDAGAMASVTDVDKKTPEEHEKDLDAHFAAGPGGEVKVSSGYLKGGDVEGDGFNKNTQKGYDEMAPDMETPEDKRQHELIANQKEKELDARFVAGPRGDGVGGVKSTKDVEVDFGGNTQADYDAMVPENAPKQIQQNIIADRKEKELDYKFEGDNPMRDAAGQKPDVGGEFGGNTQADYDAMAPDSDSQPWNARKHDKTAEQKEKVLDELFPPHEGTGTAQDGGGRKPDVGGTFGANTQAGYDAMAPESDAHMKTNSKIYKAAEDHLESIFGESPRGGG